MAQPAHVPHILRIKPLVVLAVPLLFDVVMAVFHAMNHRTGPQEQERLEARVCHQMEHCRCIGPDANRRNHVAELAYGAVGQHALDVPLPNGDIRGHQRRGRADHGDDKRAYFGGLVKHVRAHHHIHASGYHRRRVNERANGRRTGHRVRQPHEQRNLRAFPRRAEQKQQCDQGQRGLEAQRHAAKADVVAAFFQPGRSLIEDALRSGVSRFAFSGQRRRIQRGFGACSLMHGWLFAPVVIRQRPERPERDQHAHDQPEVAHPVHNKRFARGVAVFPPYTIGPVEPEPDQEVRAQPYPFPTDKHHQIIVASDQGKHKDQEQVHIHEETLIARVPVHVTHGVEVNERADSRHDQHHRDA